GPKGSPLLGSALSLKNDMLGTVHRAMLEYGDVVRFTVGPPGRFQEQAFGVFHPDYIQHVLAGGAGRYEKNDGVYIELRHLLGDGLLTSEGEEWKRQKRMIQPIFTHRRVASYVPMMAEETAATVERWASKASSGEEVDLNDEMARVTLSVVGRALFGADVAGAIPVIRRAVPYLSERAIQRAIFPLAIPEDWPTPGNRKALRYQQGLYDVVDKLIAARRANPAEGEDLLGLLIKATDPENGQRLDDREVRDQVLIFLLAGHETTATSLTFTLHLLGQNPEIQGHLHTEVDRVLEGRREPALEDVQALRYTTMVIKEAMRLYPAAYGIPRYCKSGDTIGGYDIPAGHTVFCSTWATHRHPGFWDDPERFDPERFTPEREKARPRYAYFPFGGGPRACIGQYFSMLQAVVVTAMLMQRYRVTTPDRPVKLFTGITLRPADRVPARIERR
ncbi:MAG TPA: cytochrome P450, partial [Actinomycetota bacterium]|nr:cytochrome P450 [Actinomycetota bacterium]